MSLPAHAADPEKDHSVQIDGFASVEVGGGWSEGTVTVKNDADAAYSGQHLVLYFGSQMLGVDQVVAEYGDGADGGWQPVNLMDQDLGGVPAGHQGVAADLTGAGIDVAAHSARTFKLRFKLVQSAFEGPSYRDVAVEAFLAPALGANGQAQDWTARTGKGVLTTGLTTAVNGLPTAVPADGKPHPFQVSIKTANGFDWHLTKASFFLWAGQGNGSMYGPADCDAELDVQDPKDGSWHKVRLGAAGLDERDVDLTKWATGPVDNRVINARLTLGGNFKTDTDAELGFGYFPGDGPVHFWTEQPISATPVPGAPECVDPASAAIQPALSLTPSGPAGLEVLASAAGTVSPWPVAQYRFDFGDGQTAGGDAAGSSGWHYYEQPGTYTVTATVTDDHGRWASTKQTITVTNPVAGRWTSGQRGATPAFFRNGSWALLNANVNDAPTTQVSFGQAGDLPIAGDWDGLGHDQLGIYRPSSNTFALRHGDGSVTAVPVGEPGDIPVPGLWDGNGHAQLAIYRPSTSTFAVRHDDGSYTTAVFGNRGDIPLVGDWDGVGHAQLGIYRPLRLAGRVGVFALRHDDGSVSTANYGITGDQPIVGDWLGVGRTTFGDYRPFSGRFFLNRGYVGQSDLIITYKLP
ncbi:PKD domain-containing protein [Kitasatospora sp. NPDC059327]|uniref:PKD domain-containing protein n=1 Tax=Kitasatospora sp. NPDC059327 TaxID=3346803 RepID=UPI0036834A41